MLRHIPDPPTLLLLGHSFRDVQKVPEKEFGSYTIRQKLESVSYGRLIQAVGRPEVYIIIGEEKHHVPDPNTLNSIQQLNAQIQGKRIVDVLPESEVDRWPTGRPLLSVIQ